MAAVSSISVKKFVLGDELDQEFPHVALGLVNLVAAPADLEVLVVHVEQQRLGLVTLGEVIEPNVEELPKHVTELTELLPNLQ